MYHDEDTQCDYCDLKELSESEELFFRINDLLEAEITRRVAKEIADVEAVRKQKADDGAKIAALTSEVRELTRKIAADDRKHDREIEAVKKQCAAEIEAVKADAVESLLCGLKEGDRVYMLEGCRCSLPCPTCEGKGAFDAIIDGLSVRAQCRACQGSGKKLYDGKCVEAFTVSDMILQKTKAGVVRVKLKPRWSSYSTVDVTDVLTSKEEAESRAKAYNDAAKARIRAGY